MRTPSLAFVTMSSVARKVDPVYPGTAVERMNNCMARARSLQQDGTKLSAPWPEVRRSLLWAAGLRDLTDVAPGAGYTGHAFADANHCDATMLHEVAHNDVFARVAGEVASDPDLGEGGSWSTCMSGCPLDPPQDVAHVQFRSRIAFKLVWRPPSFSTFVLVDDEGGLLAGPAAPTGQLPPLRDRQQNYVLVRGSKYAKEAEAIKVCLYMPRSSSPE